MAFLPGASGNALCAVEDGVTRFTCTSGRLMILQRHWFGGFQMVDLRWQDLRDATLREGMFTATLSLKESKGHWLSVAGLEKESARSVYVICQGQEQAWREKNRVRRLEEQRAQAGGVQVGLAGAPLAAGGHAPLPSPEDAVTRLKKAKELLVQGLITDAEYETLKAKILANL